jgi:hypothetical protein
VESEQLTSESGLGIGSIWKRRFHDKSLTIFLVALAVRLMVAAVFLGSVDTVNSLSYMPVAASHGYFYLPYFPIVENVLGSSAFLMAHLRFMPIGLFPKLLPCVADSLLSVWLLHYDRFDEPFRRKAAWIYAFCPLAIIMVSIDGQWDSLWILPMVAALALAVQTRDASAGKYRASFMIGLLFGVALISKPVALIVAGLLIPNFHSRKLLSTWLKELALIIGGALLSAGAFFLVFAREGIDLHRNFENVISYGGAPGFIVFGPARLTFFRFLTHLQSNATVIGDFRTLAVMYVFGIVLYQVFSKTPIDTMTAAASMLLIASAIGGLAPQYLIWPMAFMLAAGRLRLAVAYSVTTTLLLVLYFWIPGSALETGENIGAFLPLHSLRFLGVPTSALHWAATTSFTNEVWLPILNLYVPLAMCAVALYLLTSKWRATPSKEGLLLDPMQLRATRACVPFVAILIVAVATYYFEPTHVKAALIGVVQQGFTHYAFSRSIYLWSAWHQIVFWTVSTPYKDVQGGAWWGSVIVVGPVLALLWSYFAIRRPPLVSSEGLERVGDSASN